MIRRWHVEPDMEVSTADGVVYACSQESLIAAAANAAVVTSCLGGGFTMWSDRFPTGLPGEMVTVGAIVEWRDRTNARAQHEQPTGEPQRPMQAPDEGDLPYEAGAFPEPPPEDDPTLYRGGEPVDDIGDGLDPNTLPDEDESELEVKA